MTLKRATKKTLGLGLLAGLLLSTGVASAAPTPDRGPISGGTAVTSELPGVSFTQIAGADFTTAGLTTDGEVYVWGITAPPLDSEPLRPTKLDLPQGAKLTALSAGTRHFLGIDQNGAVYAAGDNASGELGNGATYSGDDYTSAVSKTQIPEGVKITQVAAGNSFSLAIGDNGKTYSWGSNFLGQLGNGEQGRDKGRTTPGEVLLPEGVTFTQVAAGTNHALGLATNGDVYSWGFDFAGNGNDWGNWEEDWTSTRPIKVSAPDGVTFDSITARGQMSSAQGSDGKTYIWGSALGGSLGTGTSQSGVPVVLPTPDGVSFSQVSLSPQSGVALGSDGNVYLWGYFLNQRINTPEVWPMPEGVTVSSVTATEAVSKFVIATDGHSYAWGLNNYGTLGDGSGEDLSVPIKLTDVEVTDVDFGGAPGTELSQTSTLPGEWSAVTPAHTAGTVDVTVGYTQFGQQQTLTVPNGFTFEDESEGPTQAPSETPTSAPSQQPSEPAPSASPSAEATPSAPGTQSPTVSPTPTTPRPAPGLPNTGV